MREGRRRPRVRVVPCRVVPRGDSRIGPMRADAAEIGADAAKIGSTRSVLAETAESGRN